MNRAIAAACGLVGDLLIGEPPERLHPLRAFGRTMKGVEASVYDDGRSAGLLYCAAGATLGFAVGAAMRSVAAATLLTSGSRSLASTALEISSALEVGDAELARRLLPSLVGRDPSGLDEKEIARAVVESVAENTVDAVVAPVFWALVAGSAGAVCYRAVNTMDAMVGSRSPRYERFGWASAKLDDLANWIPARITVLAVALARPSRATEVLRSVRTQAGAHPSPNAGVSEAAFASALGLVLGGENRYGDRVEVRPPLGTGRSPHPSDIERAVSLLNDVVRCVLVALVVAGITRATRSRWTSTRRSNRPGSDHQPRTRR